MSYTVVEKIELRLGDVYVGHIQDGDKAAREGDLLRAYACYRAAVAIKPRAVRALIGAGTILAIVENGDLADAEKMLREAIRLSPKNPMAHFGLGRCLAKSGRIDEAIESYRRTAELAPENTAAQLFREGLGFA